MERYEGKSLRKIKIPRKQLILIVYDIIIISLASMLALIIQSNFEIAKIDPAVKLYIIKYQVVNLVTAVILFFIFRLYSTLWRYAGVREIINLVAALTIHVVIYFLGMRASGLYIGESYYIIYFLLLFPGISVGRYGKRIFDTFRSEVLDSGTDSGYTTLIFGAGEAGQIILKEIQGSKYVSKKVPCILDDDEKKWNTYLMGVPVVGGRESLQKCVEKYHIQEILIAIPSLINEERGKLVEACQQTGCKLSILPGMYQLINREINITALRDVSLEDLLGRDPVYTNLESVMEYVSGKTVLVTGGGGSIGSEICRQIARHLPKTLIILDEYENNAYDLQMELDRRHPHLHKEVIIANVQNQERIHWIFQKYRPEVVYHAAAHKHVPLMEASPCEAIKNNVFGTAVVAQEADLCGVKKFVMISTDKAVRPTNIMGASKRICEMIIQSYNNHSDTEYVAVRFGNVLGSNGSVVPLFKKQIEEGGPITVTHPDIIRYFMTIPEAVSLVLQAGAYAHGGEIFILNMGEPVKILDMAKKLIRLSGFTPGVDIKIEFTGLRPGEKLYEELLMEEEKTETENPRIFVGKAVAVDEEFLKEMLQKLYDAAYDENQDIRSLVQQLVPEYHIPEHQKINE